MPASAHIAVDLGAESGRVIVGAFDGRSLKAEECHRFGHQPVPTPAGLCWDLTGIWREILDGLRAASAFTKERSLEPRSIGVDTWAVDYALVSQGGELLGLPRCYRDPAFVTSFERVTRERSRREIYEQTGIQHLPFNTLYQYAERSRRESCLYQRGNNLLFIPDLIHWLLSGIPSTERTNASTSQMVDVRTGRWNLNLLDSLHLPTSPLLEPIDPGTRLGTIREQVAAETGLPGSMTVVAPATHDTASAIAAVPAVADSEWCYLSSGTWSLLGAELSSPCITAASAEANLTNELGVNRTVRFLKNISGLWLVRRLRAELEADGHTLTYTELAELAAGAEPFNTLIPVNDATIVQGANLREAICALAVRTGQAVPGSIGQLVRCCLESLALEYRGTLETLERVLDRRFATLHVVGGGSKNSLLNGMTADAIGRPVVVGPMEATAAGNLLVQAMSADGVCDLGELRTVVRRSITLETIEPRGRTAWDDAHGRYSALLTDTRS